MLVSDGVSRGAESLIIFSDISSNFNNSEAILKFLGQLIKKVRASIPLSDFFKSLLPPEMTLKIYFDKNKGTFAFNAVATPKLSQNFQSIFEASLSNLQKFTIGHEIELVDKFSELSNLFKNRAGNNHILSPHFPVPEFASVYVELDKNIAILSSIINNYKYVAQRKFHYLQFVYPTDDEMYNVFDFWFDVLKNVEKNRKDINALIKNKGWDALYYDDFMNFYIQATAVLSPSYFCSAFFIGRSSFQDEIKNKFQSHIKKIKDMAISGHYYLPSLSPLKM